jgi:transcriptional regulator with XRE-family HTH domain
MHDIYLHISTTLKQLRQERGWSLDKTAEETGVSKAMLGQIERKESSPTISTLWKIAAGFRVSFSSLIGDIDHELKQAISRPEVSYHPEDKKIRVLPIFPYDSQLKFEVYILELLPGCEHLSPAHQQGVVEHVIVTEGEVEVLVDGVWHKMIKGEGIKFVADQAHGYRNISGAAAVIHDIIHY